MHAFNHATVPHSQPYAQSRSRRENLIKTVDSIGTSKHCKRRQEICNSEDGARSWYRLVKGAARRYAILPDGRRQITAFILPGDFFGFQNEEGEGWIIEAICEGTAIIEYAPRRVEALAVSDVEIAHELLEVVFQTISRLEDQVLAIGRGKAAEKVALFLLHFADHPSLSRTQIMTLPLSRYDIADYLAISPETVCRCFTDLRNQGVIKLLGPRQLTIVDREALKDRAH